MNKVLTVIAMGAMLPLCAQTEDIRFGVKAGLIQPQGKTFKTEARIGAQIGISATKDLGRGHAVRVNADFNQFGSKKINTGKYAGKKKNATEIELAKALETSATATATVTAAADAASPSQKQAAKTAKEATLWKKNSAKVNTASIGVDYIYHLNKQDDGAYIIAGIDVERANTAAKIISREITKAGTMKKDGKKVGSDQEYTKWKEEDNSKSKKHSNKVGFKLGAGYALDKNMGIEATYSTHKYQTNEKKSDKHGVFGLGLTYKF